MDGSTLRLSTGNPIIVMTGTPENIAKGSSVHFYSFLNNILIN